MAVESDLSHVCCQGRGRWKLVCAGLIAAAAIFVTVKGVRKASVSLRGAADVALSLGSTGPLLESLGLLE